MIYRINYYKTLYFSLVFFCLIAIFGGAVYRLYRLNNLGVAIGLILAIIAVAIRLLG